MDRVVAAVAESLAAGTGTGAGEQLAFERIERLVTGSAGNGEYFDIEVSVRNSATGAIERRPIVLSADVTVDADGVLQQTPLSSPAGVGPAIVSPATDAPVPPDPVPPPPTAGPTVEAVVSGPGFSTAGNADSSGSTDTGAAVGVTLCVLVLLGIGAGLFVRHQRQAAANALFADRGGGGGGGGGGAKSSSSTVLANPMYDTYDSQGDGNGSGGAGGTVYQQAIPVVVKPEGGSIETVYAAVELASPPPTASFGRSNTLVLAGGTTCKDLDACPGPSNPPTLPKPSLLGVARWLTHSRDCVALSPAQTPCRWLRWRPGMNSRSSSTQVPPVPTWPALPGWSSRARSRTRPTRGRTRPRKATWTCRRPRLATVATVWPRRGR